MANIYDGAFRTILNDCRNLVIPIINEIFGETYTGEEEIRFFPNEHFLDQQDEADRERITDTNFTVFGKTPKKYHIECESNFPEYNSNGQKMEELKAEYQVILERLDGLEQQGVIGAFDKRTIIELSGDVIKEIAQKYKNVQEGVGDMMSGALIETSARKILNQGISQNQRETALRMLEDGELPFDKIAKYSGLKVEDVEQLAELQTV